MVCWWLGEERLDDIEALLWFMVVGAKTWRPSIKGLSEAEDRILDNEKLFTLDMDLSKLVALGGRAQGVKIAQIMARSGVDMVLLQRSPRLPLPRKSRKLSYS